MRHLSLSILCLIVQSEKNPLDFADEIVEEGHLFKGFNLVLADLCSETMVYVSNRPKGEPVTVEKVLPGLHVLTNARLDSPWHKVNKCNIDKLCSTEMKLH